jgi:hypothetical protein
MRIADLVLDDRLSSRVFTDPEIFGAELELIWRRLWVYVGHESEIPQPGDSAGRAIGLDPVVLERTEADALRVRTARGDLVPRIDSYRGFVFASLAPEGITLQEHLGAAAPLIDRFCDLSPTGRVTLTRSVLKTRYDANWKLVLDNAVDGYHPVFLHQAMFKSYRGSTPDWYSDEGKVHNGSLGRGHAVLDFSEQNRIDRGGVMAGLPPVIRERVEREYVDALAGRLGAEEARLLTDEGYSNVSIFPNLLLIQQDVRTVEPVAVGVSVVYNRAALLEGAPDELNLARLRQESRAYGPAGTVTPDDFEIFERCQRAFATAAPDWMLLSRGAWREEPRGAEVLVGRATDEVGHRGIWQHYREVMTEGSR